MPDAHISVLYCMFSSISFCVKIRLDLQEHENVCSVASKRGRYHQEVTIGSHTSRTVPFVIIPMREGEVSIEVKAAVKDSWLNDGVMKMLRVVVRECAAVKYLNLIYFISHL